MQKLANTKKNKVNKLHAKALKKSLWETLQQLRAGEIKPGEADSIACLAREIVRTSNSQLKIFAAANKQVSRELLDFAQSKE